MTTEQLLRAIFEEIATGAEDPDVREAAAELASPPSVAGRAECALCDTPHLPQSPFCGDHLALIQGGLS